jgi:ankyrin repeat protein
MAGHAQTKRELTDQLYHAASHCEAEKVEELLRRGADPNGRREYGYNMLFCGVVMNSEQIVLALLRAGAKVNDVADPNTGATALHKAAEWGKSALINALLDHGAFIDKRNRWGQTALHVAASGWDDEDVELLLSRGAKTDIRGNEGETPLILAARGNELRNCRALLKRGADPNIPDREGSTPLLEALYRGDLEMTELVLQYGVKVNSADKLGHTPILVAAADGRADLVQLLLEHGANPSAQSKAGWSPLMAAAERGHVGPARLLLDRGADANARDKERRTALHYLLRPPYKVVSECISMPSFERTRVTITRRGSANLELLRLLLARGANVTLRDKKGKTPLQLAEEQGYKEAARLLREAGAR